jgi:uncharacterized membrane protein YphA (DoxX/SURF4 family)
VRAGESDGTRERRLQRLFSSFPGGWPGVGLLLLRTAIGAAAAAQGALFLIAPGAWTMVAGAIAVAGGACLSIGFLTPASGAAIALVTGACAMSGLFSRTPTIVEEGLAPFLMVTVSAALVLLGPGALSVDARLFGRREIVIPYDPDAWRRDPPR